MITLVPDAGLLTIITLRLIQRLCLLYGFDFRNDEQKSELWLAAAAATGIDFGKDLAEKGLVEKIAPMIVERLAVRLGAKPRKNGSLASSRSPAPPSAAA